MGTKIRAELSSKNKYWISKHRYYELKHFCLQYPSWIKAYSAIQDICALNLSNIKTSTNDIVDPTGKCAVAKLYYVERIDMIRKVAVQTDPELYMYILRAVTEELSFTYLKTKLEIPCGKDTYYDRYRKFFWLLSQERN